MENSHRSHHNIYKDHDLRTTGSINRHFLHNGRVFLSFLPCFAVLAAFGGRWVVGSIMVGLVATYIAEALGSKRGSLVCIWTTLAATELTLVESSVSLLKDSFANVLFLFNVVFFVVLTGIWLCLNLDLAVISLNPLMLSMLERALFACFPFPAVIILTWATIAILGLEYAPLYFCIYFCIYYSIFGQPVRASWPQTVHKAATDDPSKPVHFQRVSSRVENAFHTFACSVFPALFYITIFHRVLFNYEHLSILAAVIAIPNLVIVAQSDSLWWIGDASKINVVRKIVGIFGAVLLLASIEYRVIFRSFSHYIAAYPPWSYLFVTVAIYSLSYFLVAHFTGFVPTPPKKVSLAIALMAASAISLVLGTEIYFLPFPLLNAYFFVNFYYHRKLSDYLAFLVTILLFLAWFSQKTFYFIDYSFGAVSLQSTVWLVAFVFLFSFLIIGWAITHDNPHILGLLLLLHSFSLSLLENLLYPQREPIYPPYLVFLTSALGGFLICKLENEKRITNTYSWLTASSYCAKLFVLLSPYTSYAFISAYALIATISPLYYFHKAPTMKRELALTYVSVIGIVSFFTKQIIPAIIYELFAGVAPSSSQILSFFFIIWGFGCLPLSMKFFVNQHLVKSINLLLIAVGILFAIIQPDFDGGFSLDNLGSNVVQFLFILASVLVIVSFLPLLPLRKSDNLRAVYSVITGATIGLYFSASYLPFNIFIYSSYTILFTLVGTFLVFTQYPTQKSLSSGMTVWLYIIVIVLLFPIWIAEPDFSDAINPKKKSETIDYLRVVCLSTYSGINVVIALFLKFKSQDGSEAKEHAEPASARAGSRYSPSTKITEDWIPLIGNVAAILALLLSLSLNMFLLNGSVTCIFVLAPILLLLNKDNTIFKNLNEDTRFYPIIIAITTFLTLDAAARIWIIPLTSPSSPFFWIDALWNTVLLGLTLPSHYHFIFHQFWSFHKLNAYVWLIVTPLNILPVFFADYTATSILGIMGVFEWALSYQISRKTKLSGLKAI